jgi:hypothetical protein
MPTEKKKFKFSKAARRSQRKQAYKGQTKSMRGARKAASRIRKETDKATRGPTSEFVMPGTVRSMVGRVKESTRGALNVGRKRNRRIRKRNLRRVVKGE